MATRWFKDLSTMEYGYANSFSITGRLYTVISDKIDGVEYGTRTNPAYSVGASRSYAWSNGWRYSPYQGYTLSSEDGASAKYRSIRLVGCDGDPISNSYSGEIANTQISGKWKSKESFINVQSGEKWCEGWMIPLTFTVTRETGSITNCRAIGCNENYVNPSSSTCRLTYQSLTGGNTTIPYNTSARPSTPASLSGREYTFDFGDIPQDVPETVLNFFETNFERVYGNEYTVLNTEGQILAQISEQPPIIGSNLRWVNTTFELELLRSDNQFRLITWSLDVPADKKFVGLSNKPNGAVIIPLGEASISLERSTSLYPVFVPYRELTETFDITLYQNEAEYNRLDKTDFLFEVGTLSGVLREAVSVTDLVITIESSTFPTFNYIYIDKFKRYYFVNDISILANNLFEIDLSVDPLMSYKDAIRNLTAFIDRAENSVNPYIIDKKRVIKQGVDISVEHVPNSVFDEIFDPETSVRFVMNGYKLSVRANVL